MKKVFVITGANRGLGKAFVDILIKKKGVFVISISRSQSEEQKKYGSNKFYFLETDLSENTLVKNIHTLKGLLSNKEIYFINNASVVEPINTIKFLKENDIYRTISVNVKSPMLIVQYLLDHFINQKLVFINISSGAAERAIHSWSLYCSSKAFIKMFFEVAEKEYQQHQFLNIDPGVMDTNMQTSIRDNDFPDAKDFKKLHAERKLKSPIEVASEILIRVL